KYPQLDPHIGIVYVHDSTRYTNNINQNNSVLKFHPLDHTQQYFEKGELVSLQANSKIDFIDGKKLNLLPDFFNIEVPFVNIKTEKKVKGETIVEYPIGPEVEESFSPVSALINNKSAHKSFFRKDALLVVIFVTDAETGYIPESNLKQNPDLISIVEKTTPKELYEELLAFKSGQAANILAYGVLCENDDVLCQNKGIEKPALKIKSFINLVHENRNASLQARFHGSTQAESKLQALRILNLNSDDWGEKLATIGEAISLETLLKPTNLSFVPEVKVINNRIVPQIKVKMGTQTLEFKKHWQYDAAENSITLLPTVLKLSNPKAQEFVIVGTAVDMVNKQKTQEITSRNLEN
ncbi:MAG: hypothetical protein KDD40_11665, partial [Bdellovibrionales bacterium]|nr:hypothetical protein [Bdellovibrionales bacterium]